MTIDLSNVGNGHELNDYERSVLLSNHLCKEISIANSEEFNYIIVSMKIYNLLESSTVFKKERSISPGESVGVWHIGYLGGFNVYVDMLLDPDMILMRYDKQIMRDNKIDSILGNTESRSIDIDVIGI